MSSGDKEIILASEDVQRKNIKVAIAHANETRKMIIELGKIVDALQNQVIAQSEETKQLRYQLATLQQQFYSKGTVSYTGD